VTDGAPRVAVIIPAYDRADLLPDALDSVLSQTYGDWEAVIIDNASTDGTLEVARGYERRDPERITVLTLAENVGPGGARNLGIAASQGGELVCLLDSDDRLREAYLERLVGAYDEATEGGRQPGVVSCDALIETPEGLSGETLFGRYGRVDPVDFDSMVRRNCLSARAVFSRAAYEAVGGAFAAECRGSDDHDLWLRMMEAGYAAVVVPEALAVYRDHPGCYSYNRVLQSEGKIVTYRRALARGALTRRQRRVATSQILHYRAVLEWELLYQAIAGRRPRTAARRVLRAAPLAIAAFAQRPSRWARWTRVAVRQGRELAGGRRATANP
jgi:glycosyltransferase involved in cell wall biosynthesis